MTNTTDTTTGWDRLYRKTEGYGRRYPFEPLIVYVQRLKSPGHAPDGMSDGAHRALDIGFGTIADLVMLHEAGYEVHGLEVSENAISRAESALKGVEIPYTMDLWEPGTVFPLVSNSFDLAVSIGAIHYNLDQGHVLGEIHRVLKPEGRFMTTYHGPEFYYTKFTEIVRPGVRRYTQEYPNETMRGIEFVVFDGKDDLKDLYEQHFQDVEISNYRYRLLGQLTSFWLVTGVAG
jgi:SAM-dependent methyltransferase